MGRVLVRATGTNRSGSNLRMQGDGDAVIVAPGNVAVWSTGTNGNPDATLELQTDGNLVVHASGHASGHAAAAGRTASSSPPAPTAPATRPPRSSPTALSSCKTVHVSGVSDNADARQKIVGTAGGQQAARSADEGAPGGRVSLDPRMLAALRRLGAEGGLRAGELAGGSHGTGSRHHAGRAFDLDQYGGRSTTTIVNRCRRPGATLARFENGNHVHCEWT